MALLNKINVKGTEYPIVTDDGYYQEMSVGGAEQLISTVFVEDEVPYNFRTTGGSADVGNRKTEKIIGGTIAWNQLVNNGNFAENSGWVAGNNGSLVIANNKATITKSGTTGEVVSLTKDASNRSLSISGHKYLIITQITSANKIGIVPTGTTGDGWSGYSNAGDYTTKKTLALIWGCAVNKPMLFDIRSYQGSGVSTDINTVVENLVCFDLTQMFGSTIANAIYSLEQSQAGAGVAWFKKLFPKPYYAYDAGSLQSVKALRHITRGFNAWDEEWEVYGSSQIKSKNLIPLIPNTTYYLKAPAGTGATLYFKEDTDIPSSSSWSGANETFTVPSNIHYAILYAGSGYGTTYNHDICINLSWDGERDGEYEEYEEHVYELDPDLELQGTPRLAQDGSLYYNGDEYESDGTVTRKARISTIPSNVNVSLRNSSNGVKRYLAGLADLHTDATQAKQNGNSMFISAKLVKGNGYSGDVPFEGMLDVYNLYFVVPDTYSDADAKALIVGSLLCYDLNNPQEESANPYTSPMVIDDFGTEEYVDAGVAAETPTRDVAIPVGHFSEYMNNLRAKLEMAPDSPENDGYYVVYHHDGINEYTPLIIPQELPDMPTEDGTYTLKCTVASGTATLSFEEVTE